MDSSDESGSERQNLLAKFLTHPGTIRTDGRPGNRPTLRGTQTLASTIMIKPPSAHVETGRPFQPPTPMVERPRREPLVDSPNGPLINRTLPADSHTRGRIFATSSRGPRAHSPRKTLHISQQSSELGGSMGRNSGAQRPRRSRGRPPANYYAKSNYSGYAIESESDSSAGEGRDETRVTDAKASEPKGSVAVSLQVPARFQPKTVSRVIHASGNLRIYRRTYCSFDEIADLPKRVPYAPEANALDYVRRCEEPRNSPLQHVSMSSEELEAMIQLIALFSVNPTSPDISLADQIIEMVKSLPISRLEDFIIRQIFKMKKVQRRLTRYGFDHLSEYHDGKERLKMSRRSSIEALLTDIQKSTANSDPSQWLATAAKLDRRRKSDILAFVGDARLGFVPTQPYYVVAARNLVGEHVRFRQNRTSAQHGRECSSAYGLERSQTWKGASNDVIGLAWSPDGTQFAVGAAAHCDEHNRQYNRPNNLLLGNTLTNSIRELPDHRLPYPSLNAGSPHLYMSVSAVQWHDNVLYTASYDRTVKLWDVSSYESASCMETLQHDYRVQVMARPHDNPRVLATGTDSALYLWHMGSKTSQPLDFMQQRSIKVARFARNIDLVPSALAWGSLQSSNLLAAGFSGKEAHEGDLCREGLLTMWRLTESSVEPMQLQPNAQNVFDVKFHPTLPWLATGSSVPAMGANGYGKDIRSLVRVYEPLKKTRCALELDCPALDINDVTFCPMDRSIISASCTDGVTYVWDYRNPGQILHRLAHGNALNQLNEELTREQADVGVRVALWDNTIDNFVTGGSDGALKSWNILRAPEDVFVRDIALVGDEIMSGAFSPDKTSLVIGDDSGGIHVFAKGVPADDVRTMDFDYGYGSEDMAGLTSDSGRAIGQQLLSTGQLVRHPTYGVGQGPAYQGPYAAWARPEGTPKDKLAITPLLQDLQLQQFDAPGAATRPEQQRRVAALRNKPDHKRKRHPDKPGLMAEIVNFCSDDEEEDQSHQPRRILIDLTSDSDSGKEAPEGTNDCNHIDDHDDNTVGLDVGLSGDETDLEDYWFPDSGDIDANIRHSSE